MSSLAWAWNLFSEPSMASKRDRDGICHYVPSWLLSISMEMESNGPLYNLFGNGFNYPNKVEGNDQKAEKFEPEIITEIQYHWSY